MSEPKEQSITERDALEWVRRKLIASGEVTREQADAYVKRLAEGKVNPKEGTFASLEQELAAQLKLDENELLRKAASAEGVHDPGQALVWATGNVFGPLLKQYQEAILRLAREVDELKGNHGEQL